ncbi:MAG: hypothetical protein HS128_12465 [Ideonella sp.]|nr:hypothetical protein [Ideonella sp.]
MLMGGRGSDLLVGGAGDDDLNGDDDYAPGSGAPWSVASMPGNEFDRLYDPVVSYNRADDRGAGDILYGGGLAIGAQRVDSGGLARDASLGRTNTANDSAFSTEFVA